MNRTKHGTLIFSQDEIFDALYKGKIKTLDNIILDKINSNIFNQAAEINGDDFFVSSENEVENNNHSAWFMPENYCPNLIEDLYSLCQTQEEKNRLDLELTLFVQHNMLDLIFYLKYLVDTMRTNNIVWGVGRGSSVASYVLYLLGVHKINSLKYELDINEFLREKQHEQSL